MHRIPKILVEIIGGPYPQKRKCKLNREQTKVIISEGAKGRGASAIDAEFDNTCLVPYFSGLPPFRSIKYKLHYVTGAKKCVSYTLNNKKEVETPSCTKEDVQSYAQATVIKQAGSLKPPVNMGLVYVLIIISIIVGVIGIAVSSGNLRF